MNVVLASVALIAALGASILLLFIPFYEGVEEIAPGGEGSPQSFTRTLVQMNGWDVLIPLAIPPVLAAGGLLAVLRAHRYRKLLVWITAFMLAVFVFLTGFSIGTFYVPSMILLMTSAIVTQFESPITKKQKSN